MAEVITVTTSLTAVREALADARAVLPAVAEGNAEVIERALNYADIAADGAERLHAELLAATKAVVDAEFQLSCEDAGAAWERIGDWHRSHGNDDPDVPCAHCLRIYPEGDR